MIGEWRPDPAPEWVTAVPSTRSGGLVEDFAARLAVALQLPFHDITARIAERPQQRTLQNSAHQRANVRGAFSVTTSPPASPGLLVDDLYDSGWTMAEVGAALRRAGAGPVYPVALGSTTGRRT